MSRFTQKLCRGTEEFARVPGKPERASVQSDLLREFIVMGLTSLSIPPHCGCVTSWLRIPAAPLDFADTFQSGRLITLCAVFPRWCNRGANRVFRGRSAGTRETYKNDLAYSWNDLHGIQASCNLASELRPPSNPSDRSIFVDYCGHTPTYNASEGWSHRLCPASPAAWACLCTCVLDAHTHN